MDVDGFVRALVGLLAVSNVLPILPIVLEFTAGLPPDQARRYRLLALLQGNAVGIAFLLGAPALLQALTLDLNDLRIAGGTVLLVYATYDLLFSRMDRNRRFLGEDAPPPSPLAPLGVPILVGPATLSVLLVLGQAHGVAAVGGAMGVNLVLNMGILAVGDRLLGVLGEGGRTALGKVSSLVVATLGTAMIRRGVLGVLE